MNRIVYYLKKRHYFKKGKIFLEKGLYFLSGSVFFSYDKNIHKKTFWNIIHISDCKTILKRHNSGFYYLGRFKAKFIFDDSIYFLLYDKERYYQSKEAYGKYYSNLFYNTAKYIFIDSKLLVSTNIVHGKHFYDDSHFESFLKTILSQYSKSLIFERRNLAEFSNVPFFIQHGDCKNENIIWEKDNPTLIDLEAIDSYPIFYDLFYYVFITKKEKALETLTCIESSIIDALFKIGEPSTNNPIDYYLSCYITYLCKYISKDFPESTIIFYLGWINYSDYSGMTILKRKINKIKSMIREIGYTI